MKIKRIIGAFFIVLSIFMFTACGNKTDSSSKVSKEDQKKIDEAYSDMVIMYESARTYFASEDRIYSVTSETLIAEEWIELSSSTIEGSITFNKLENGRTTITTRGFVYIKNGISFEFEALENAESFNKPTIKTNN